MFAHAPAVAAAYVVDVQPYLGISLPSMLAQLAPEKSQIEAVPQGSRACREQRMAMNGVRCLDIERATRLSHLAAALRPASRSGPR